MLLLSKWQLNEFYMIKIKRANLLLIHLESSDGHVFIRLAVFCYLKVCF